VNAEHLKQPFTEELFLRINDQLINAEMTKSQLAISSNNSKLITAAKYFGSFDDLDLHILSVEHSGTEDTRVGVSLDIFKLMKKYSFGNAIIAAHQKTSNSWRYSLVTSNLSIDDKGKITKKFSNPRRHSFVLGPNQKVMTPYKQLVQSGKASDIQELSKRFSIEVVNNEFYKEIAKLYDELVGTDKISGVLKHPDSAESKHEFAVRLVGRVIFAWFLREKADDTNKPLISKSLLSRNAANISNYYHSFLAPLFFEVLNSQVHKRRARFQKDDFADVPYLNGGLFTPQYDDHYSYDEGLESATLGVVEIPDEWIRKLLDLLELYNFTVDENTTIDIDLSIDPEMLGRIFENLLARINPETGETVRKSTGVYGGY
jgi:adenine-specific DNA-methyltransferase